MNPYEADPAKIPAPDLYADVPLFGRYSPREDDLQPNAKYFMSTSPESLEYWSSVLDLCDASARMVEGLEGGREVFALGSIVVKSSHITRDQQGRRSRRGHSFGDVNEVAASSLAREAIPDIRIPRIYFAGKISDWDIIVQERIPGVALKVAWQYLSMAQKMSFKEQARDILRRLHKIQPPPGLTCRSYIVPDPDPGRHRGIQQLEYDIIFSAKNNDADFGFMHNDLNTSNIIVDNDRIVGHIDWEMAGYFGWKAAAEVHAKIRCPQAESYAHLNPPLPKELLNDILFWNGLYDI